MAVLYVELGLFLLAIIWPIVARLLSTARTRTPREEPISDEHRDLVVSRLTTN